MSRPAEHYCTYFDRGFLPQGLALWRSLARHDPPAELWVLALDDFTADLLVELGEAGLHVVRLAELEAADPDLARAKENRTRVEYYFTLSPCWPRWLLQSRPELRRLTYLDADLCFFSGPERIYAAMDLAEASVVVTEHRFPSWLRHYERHGRFNVGLLVFRNDRRGQDCLDDWRERCLAWCHDRVEADRYADQKYLERWPGLLGPALLVLGDAAVNLAPWNWEGPAIAVGRDGSVVVNGGPLVVFHFARFRSEGEGWWQSGQLDYGIMPVRLRNAIYRPYVTALRAARDEVAARRPGFDFPPQPARSGREVWRQFVLRAVFGGDWLLLESGFRNFRFGLGRLSGRTLALFRRVARRWIDHP
jgi:hypothetical protein